MTWHLKDRELEKKLIAIDPEFVDKLQTEEGCGKHGFYLDLGGCVYCGDCGVPKIQIYLVREELEEVAEYNPNAWNEYPAVTPPDNVLMRLEFTETESTGKPKRHYVAATFNGITWGTRDSYSASFKMTKCRFRPWEDCKCRC